jgi:DNA invertase Pin-like site-specific DNA recombinase
MAKTTLEPQPDGGHDERPVFGYVRVSTNKQETERQEHTIPRRLATLPDGLAGNDLELFYRDRGKSAWSGKPRPDFERMMERIKNREASALIVDTSSRLTRQGIRAALSISWNLEDAACRLFTTQGREYTFDIGGIISLIVDAEADERYSATLSHNIASGKATKASAGRWHHGKLGPGYRFDKDTGYLEPTDDLLVIAEIFRLFNEGETFERLCTYANEQLTAAALERHKNGVKPGTVRHWLANPIYDGKIRHQGKVYDGKHKPAVDCATFQAAQRRLKKNRTEHVRPARSWPFSRIAKCCHCGGSLWLNSVPQRNGQSYRYFVCRDRECAKTHPRDNAAAADANIVLALAATAAAAADLLAEDPDFAVTTDDGPSLAEAQAAHAAATARCQKLAQLIADDTLDRADPKYVAALRERETAAEAVERIAGATRTYRDELGLLVENVAGLAELAPEDAHAGRPIDETMTIIDGNQERTFTSRHNGHGPSLLRILEGWRLADFDQRRAVIAQALEAVTVFPDRVDLHFRAALPEPLTINGTASTYGRTDEIRALEAEGYGTTEPVVPVEDWL